MTIYVLKRVQTPQKYDIPNQPWKLHQFNPPICKYAVKYLRVQLEFRFEHVSAFKTYENGFSDCLSLISRRFCIAWMNTLSQQLCTTLYSMMPLFAPFFC